MSKTLQRSCNLIFAAGTIHVEDSSDSEERNEITKAYDLIESYNLHGKLRWLPSINKLDTGEAYRVIFGDLRAETVSAERLAQLEGRD